VLMCHKAVNNVLIIQHVLLLKIAYEKCARCGSALAGIKRMAGR